MNDDASLARNTAGPAISSALAHRPIGIAILTNAMAACDSVDLPVRGTVGSAGSGRAWKRVCFTRNG